MYLSWTVYIDQQLISIHILCFDVVKWSKKGKYVLDNSYIIVILIKKVNHQKEEKEISVHFCSFLSFLLTSILHIFTVRKISIRTYWLAVTIHWSLHSWYKQLQEIRKIPWWKLLGRGTSGADKENIHLDFLLVKRDNLLGKVAIGACLGHSDPEAVLF